MSDEDFRKELILRKQKLRADIAEKQKQEAACDALLKTLPAQRESSTSSEEESSDGIVDAVNLAVAAAPKEFSVKDVFGVVQASIPEATKETVGSAFWKKADEMIKGQKLKIKQKGQGRRPTLYEKI